MTGPSFRQVAGALLAQKWTFAKTMPKNPHFWTERVGWQPRWDGDISFDDAVLFIREHGYKLRFGKSTYTCLDVNEHRYWTMGAPLEITRIINRAVNDRPADFDPAAAAYDGIFANPTAVAESAAAVAMVGADDQSVLDIGCGTGLLLDLSRPAEYVGVDPSSGMLAELASKHPKATTWRCGFEAFWTPQTFDRVASLFGSPAYIAPEALRRIPAMLRSGGRYVLMFYAEGYVPVTDRETGIAPKAHPLDRDILPGVWSRHGNFEVLIGGV